MFLKFSPSDFPGLFISLIYFFISESPILNIPATIDTVPIAILIPSDNFTLFLSNIIVLDISAAVIA